VQRLGGVAGRRTQAARHAAQRQLNQRAAGRRSRQTSARGIRIRILRILRICNILRIFLAVLRAPLRGCGALGQRGCCA
jgi:hypothetical protein